MNSKSYLQRLACASTDEIHVNDELLTAINQAVSSQCISPANVMKCVVQVERCKIHLLLPAYGKEYKDIWDETDMVCELVSEWKHDDLVESLPFTVYNMMVNDPVKDIDISVYVKIRFIQKAKANETAK